jgi:hypothetical protein
MLWRREKSCTAGAKVILSVFCFRSMVLVLRSALLDQLNGKVTDYVLGNLGLISDRSKKIFAFPTMF